jgi:hypothetical protein
MANLNVGPTFNTPIKPSPQVPANLFEDKHNPAEERALFDPLFHPVDSYENGQYWADMPLRQRLGFIFRVDNAESKKEVKSIGSMMKKDPLSPLSYYFKHMVIPGAGLGLEG